MHPTAGFMRHSCALCRTIDHHGRRATQGGAAKRERPGAQSGDAAPARVLAEDAHRRDSSAALAGRRLAGAAASAKAIIALTHTCSH